MWSFIGPVDDVWDTDLFDALSAFYVELFKSFNLTDAKVAASQPLLMHTVCCRQWTIALGH
jgi:hypothetical protein